MLSQVLSAPTAAAWWRRLRLPSIGASAGADDLTALSIGERCQMARVRIQPGGEKLLLVDVDEGDAAQLRRWRDDGRVPRHGALLVLHGRERHWLVLERPQVPDAELPLAVRFPLAEAMEVEPDALLTTAVPLPPISEGARRQVLAVGGRIDSAREQLARLQAAGIQARSIDIQDTALRGMVRLQGPGTDGWIVAAVIGTQLCIALVWHGRIGALRSLALPERAPRDEADYLDHLALHIQRTCDHFERQANRLAVRQVLVSLPGLSAEARDQVCSALPYASRRFEIDEAMSVGDALRERLAAHQELAPLACVAAARLLDRREPVPPIAEPAEAAA